MWRKWVQYFTAAILAMFTNLVFAGPVMAASATIYPGISWYDTSGNLIEAHGGGMIKVGNTYYWFGEDHGTNDPDVECYASTDLVNWTFEGHALVPGTSGDFTSSSVVERPKVLYNSSTNKYVMYFHLDNSSYGYAHVGVATSSNVTGPYTYQGSYQPLGHDIRDMTVFEDSNGNAYLMGAVDGNANFSIFQLSSDYLTATSLLYTWSNVYYEAPAMVQVNGRYFLITSKQNGWNPAQQQYTSSTSLSGGWSSWTNVGNSTNYDTQTTFIQPVQGTSGTTYLYMTDRWDSKNLSASSYVWMPMTISGTTLSYQISDSWQIDATAGTYSVPASPIVSGGTYEVLNEGSGLALDEPGGKTSNGTNVEQWTLNGGSNQLWTVSDNGDGTYTLTNHASRRVLEDPAFNQTEGTDVDIWDSNGGTNQHWIITPNADGTYTLTNEACTNVLEDPNWSTANGTLMDLWALNDGGNQHWQLVAH